MPNVTANGIRIEYDTFGDSSCPPLLLIRGLGGQMIGWDGALCNQLAQRDLFVIRFDNRDVGLSSKMEAAGEPDIIEAFSARQHGEVFKAPYTLDDMADDTVGLLDALGLEKAHVCGLSLGGMIAQIMAIRHPARVMTLISMQSSTGDPNLPPGKPEAIAVLLEPAPADREASVEHDLNLFRTIAGPKYPLDEQLTRRQAERSYDRCHYPPGMVRQTIAAMVAGDRTQSLRSVSAPTLVIHGSDDPLIPVEHGVATAEAISGADLMIIEGLGHGLFFPDAWPLWVDAIASHTRKAHS